MFVDFCLFNNRHSDQWEMYLTWFWIPVLWRCQSSFHEPVDHLYVFLGEKKSLLKVLYLSLIWLFMFLIKLAEFFFWITVPYRMYNVQIPFPTSRFPFRFVAGFLHCRAFLFDIVLFIFTFIFLAWGNIAPPQIFLKLKLRCYCLCFILWFFMIIWS